MDMIMLLYGQIIKDQVEEMRPPEHIRSKVDVGFSYLKQSLEIFEIRPQWNDNSNTRKIPFAKAKFTKANNNWKIYWRRASGKWELYEPMPEIENISTFFEIIKEDKHHIFRG